MATTSRQDKDFIEAVIPSDLLEYSLQWIRNTLAPQDVFDESDLDTWALDRGYTKIEN